MDLVKFAVRNLVLWWQIVPFISWFYFFCALMPYLETWWRKPPSCVISMHFLLQIKLWDVVLPFSIVEQIFKIFGWEYIVCIHCEVMRLGGVAENLCDRSKWSRICYIVWYFLWSTWFFVMTHEDLWWFCLVTMFCSVPSYYDSNRNIYVENCPFACSHCWIERWPDTILIDGFSITKHPFINHRVKLMSIFFFVCLVD